MPRSRNEEGALPIGGRAPLIITNASMDQRGPSGRRLNSGSELDGG
jgi:hypothetical protein